MLAACPKQYLLIAGKTIIEHTLDNLLQHPQIKRIIVVLHPTDKMFAHLPVAKNTKVEHIIGGKERCDSVLAGLHHLSGQEEWVLVHDAARPCLEHKDLSALLLLAECGSSGGILATPVSDTMKRADQKNVIQSTESRESLWHALTPQFFKLPALIAAIEHAIAKKWRLTDEASAMELAGAAVLLVKGHRSNIKITEPGDLSLAEFYLTHNKTEL
jgi:2-C-methyl-D-erythritol 4-phosphate cytidylyltransferase